MASSVAMFQREGQFGKGTLDSGTVTMEWADDILFDENGNPAGAILRRKEGDYAAIVIRGSVENLEAYDIQVFPSRSQSRFWIEESYDELVGGVK